MKRLFIIFLMTIVSMGAFAKSPHFSVEEFFDGRYNKEKTVRISISRDNEIYYRGFQVTGNSALVKKISEVIAKDATLAKRYTEQTGAGGKSILIVFTNNGETIYIGLQQDPTEKNAYLFIKGPTNAFK